MPCVCTFCICLLTDTAICQDTLTHILQCRALSHFAAILHNDWGVTLKDTKNSKEEKKTTG